MGPTKVETNGSKPPSSSTSPIPTVPTWVNEDHFVDVIQKHVPGFKKIIKFHTEVYGGGGENYSSIMIRVKATVELEGDLTQDVTYMIKTFPQDGTGISMVNMLGFFPKELEMYHKRIPEFEQLFSDIGKQVKFGPKSYTLKRNPGDDYILLEDLSVLGFKNVDRHEGLDKEHTESVLRLLAQLHAASAVKFATKMDDDDDTIFIMGNITQADRASFADLMEKMHDTFMECLLMTDFGAKYTEQLKQHHDGVIKNRIKLSTPDLSNFNVLNHGDLWTNNIMFRHNDEGKVEQTIFVDFQIPRLGSPAMDLYYFLLSSTNLYLKLSHFDVFIKYYHDHLVASLNQLNYTKEIPSLKQLHIDLLKYSYFAITTITGVMAAALMDPTKDANFDNFWGKGDAGKKFNVQMYSNPRYVKHLEAILEWLDTRGLMF